MSAHAPAIAAAGAGAVGFLLGSVAAWPPIRRLRTEVIRARHLAEHDPLTELPNRYGAQRHFRFQAAAGRVCAAVLLDLDDFKAVNDSWGHHVGDAHLTAVADRLATGCKPIGAFAARLAGDEFLLLLPPADPATVLRQVTALLAGVGEPLVLTFDDTTAITSTPRASAGVALPEPDTTWADLLRRADIALYQAKTQRGRAVLYTHGMYQPVSGDAREEPLQRLQTSDRMGGSRVRARKGGVTHPAGAAISPDPRATYLSTPVVGCSEPIETEVALHSRNASGVSDTVWPTARRRRDASAGYRS